MRGWPNRVPYLIPLVLLASIPTVAHAQDLIVVDQDPTVEIDVGEASLRTVNVRNSGTEAVLVGRTRTSATPAEGSEDGLTAIVRAENKEARDGVRSFGLDGTTLDAGKSGTLYIYFPAHPQGTSYEMEITYSTMTDPDAPMTIAMVGVEATQERLSKLAAFIFSLVLGLLLIILTVLAGKGRKEGSARMLGFFQSPDGEYSVSKFQSALWTLVIIMSFVYVFLIHGADVDFPPSVWGLLGISILSNGAARYIAAAKSQKQAVPFEPPDSAYESNLAHWPRAIKSMLSEGGQLSMMRMQMFGWTIVTAALFAVQVALEGELWDVSPGLLALMGISHGGYLGDKGAKGEGELTFQALSPVMLTAAETAKNPRFVILGGHFDPAGIQCNIGQVELEVDRKASRPNRLLATLPSPLTEGTYSLLLQNPGEQGRSDEVLTVKP